MSHSQYLSMDLLGRSADAVEARLCTERLHDLQSAKMYPESFQQPLGFQLELTSRCNLTCKHCYNRSGGHDNGCDDLTIEEWDKIIDEIAAIKPFQVIISGGEPLLMREWLFHAMDRLNQAPTRFVLITNGYLADQRTIDRLCSYQYYWIQVSIDGATPEIHDSFRGVKGSWERASYAAAEFAARGKALVVAHTIHPVAFETLPEMVELASILGASRIICDEAMPVGRAYSAQGEIMLTVAQRASMAETLYSLQHQYRNRMEVLRTSDPAHSFAVACATGSRVLLIRPNGDVKLDCILPFVIGNVRNQSIAEIWESSGRDALKHPRIQAFISGFQSTSDFSGCEARPYVDSDIYIGAAP